MAKTPLPEVRLTNPIFPLMARMVEQLQPLKEDKAGYRTNSH